MGGIYDGVGLGGVFVEVEVVGWLSVCILDAGDLVITKIGAEEVMFLMPVGREAVVEGVGVP